MKGREERPAHAVVNCLNLSARSNSDPWRMPDEINFPWYALVFEEHPLPKTPTPRCSANPRALRVNPQSPKPKAKCLKPRAQSPEPKAQSPKPSEQHSAK